ncbi:MULTISPECIES: hypothetical protein [unclassified Streptomyces]|uniref:hypothetical protein n=1 Tax=unclassified Streptomyces TaxID=2593676 RepID=UPI00225B86C6|nr:hypothetical protein [Streptomyces sp. NBC_00047]MCX5610816.1 hypothetical protein [Streptomyces sp. NBC_00047]
MASIVGSDTFAPPVPGAGPLAVLGDVRVSEQGNPTAGRAWVELSWPSRVRGTAEAGEGVIRHGLSHTAPGEECQCERHDCGGIAPVMWCPEHGGIAPRMEWHPGGGIRCTALRRSRREATIARAGAGQNAGCE